MRAARLFLAALIVALCVTLTVVSSTSSGATDVVTLTDANFDTLTADGAWMLEFYAPWCGHCKSLAPTWEKAAKQLRGSVKFGAIDCTSEKSLANRFAIRGYPTLKFYRDQSMRNYPSSRTLKDITEFAKMMTEPAVLTVDSESDIHRAVTDKPGASVFVLAGSDDERQPAFERVARQLQGMTTFLHWPNPPQSYLQPHRQSAERQPMIVYYSKGLEPEPFSESTNDVDAVKSFVESRRFPLVSIMSADNFDDLTQTAKKLVLFVHDPKNATSLTPIIEGLYPLAIQHRSSLLFAAVDGAKYQRWIKQFVDDTALPAIVVFDQYPESLFKPHTQPMTVADITTMIDEIVAGKRSSVSSIPWYSPQRYLRPVERYFAQFSEWQIIAGVFAVTGVAFAGLFYFCFLGDGAIDQVDELHARASGATESAKRHLEEANRVIEDSEEVLKQRIRKVTDSSGLDDGSEDAGDSKDVSGGDSPPLTRRSMRTQKQ